MLAQKTDLNNKKQKEKVLLVNHPTQYRRAVGSIQVSLSATGRASSCFQEEGERKEISELEREHHQSTLQQNCPGNGAGDRNKKKKKQSLFFFFSSSSPSPSPLPFPSSLHLPHLPPPSVPSSNKSSNPLPPPPAFHSHRCHPHPRLPVG